MSWAVKGYSKIPTQAIINICHLPENEDTALAKGSSPPL